jgi:ABC-type glycerol-3-phosphate transport system substrate-binding protein
MSRRCWCRAVVCWVVLLSGLVALAALPAARAGESPVTITYTTTLLTESAGPEIQRQIAEFEKANPGIKVEPEPSPYETYPVKMATRFRAGEASDIVGAARDWLWGWMGQGFLLDLNPVSAKGGGKAFLDTYFSSLINLATSKGKLYALPRHAGGFLL